MWKPNTLPTTFGKELCFLDMILGKDINKDTDFSLPIFLLPYIDLPDFTPCTLKKTSIHHQLDMFGEKEELGLLNRLDNETAGFLYFAKSQKAFDRYRQLQAEGKINKRYIAQVQ